MKGQRLGLAALIVVSMAVGGAIAVGAGRLMKDGSGSAAVIETVRPAETGGVFSSTVSDVASLYAKVRPSVVRINASARNGSGGLGSGIVIDKQGHILTNNHVVAGFDVIDVQLAEGASATARIVGRDPGNDLAVLQVDLPSGALTPAVLGDSDAIQVGELVIAVGNPFDLEGTVTQGIVSGVGRSLAEGAGRPLRQLIQADAAINPGNSGGALFNGRGEVVGITTAIENPSGERVFVGIGYAVPINTARRFLPDMLNGREVLHPRLGIALRDMTPALAKTLGVSVERGVLIQGVESGSAADRAGLKGKGGSRNDTGDVIVAIDGEKMNNFNDLANYIDTKNVGDTVKVTVVRGGDQQTIDVTLEAWQSS